MTTLEPRPPYTDDEFARLYPSNLELKQVQILLRHGERTPVNSRFQNAGLHEYWPYCKAANAMKAVILAADGSLDTLAWKRRLETIGAQDRPTLSAGPSAEIDAICQPGELTDRGRETTLALGQRARALYVNRLKFLPAFLDEQTSSVVRLRATPIVRALESVQQTFIGLYPAATRSPGLPPPTIVQRLYPDETLVPNDITCKRFRELVRAFADRTAKIWDQSPEMQRLNQKLGKWMPAESPTIAIASHPRLSGLLDTINATRAHGPATKLPKEFYDSETIGAIDRIVTEEWFVGYQESEEYRRLGIGSLIGDLSQRMLENLRDIPAEGTPASFKLSLSGCHDTTIAATLTALGVFRVERDPWPSFTSSIAFELFKEKDDSVVTTTTAPPKPATSSTRPSWWSALFGKPSAAIPTTRAPLSTLPASEQSSLNTHYVRVHYNDNPVPLPYCRAPGKHLPGDTSFCTLAAFKEIADQLAPKDWRAECLQNLGAPTTTNRLAPPPGVSVAEGVALGSKVEGREQ